uniref:Uncharacterized protein n=1 Tax=Candidatus Kentrum sp. TUN TaxID=2126343 RepID=A0A450ZRA0_9GAMM|nr:MAG: hypothetical protein BECKTUN1418F_GA0071002_104011 [Candidatus Kentron sp. TUN]VFK56274.1 MAG: hypothetical protein BECKTUN1418E_GA0071001_103911 [Candidatus Kentron sp. TUN]
MNISRSILDSRSAISEGKKEITNRIDGIYIGDREEIIRKVLTCAESRYILIESFESAIPETAWILLESLPLIDKSGEYGFIFDLGRGNKEDVVRFALHMEIIDSMFVFSNNLDCIFCANDDLEDVTVSLAAFR